MLRTFPEDFGQRPHLYRTVPATTAEELREIIELLQRPYLTNEERRALHRREAELAGNLGVATARSGRDNRVVREPDSVA
jgi:hypothetical protein